MLLIGTSFILYGTNTQLPTNEQLQKEIESLSNLSQNKQPFHEYEDIDSRIHELQKEIYFLRGQLASTRDKQYAWENNSDRSGVAIGIGNALDFANIANGFGIKIDHLNYGALLRFGYIKYFNNNFGIRAEVFEIPFIVSPNPTQNASVTLLHHFFGIRFSFLQDIHVVASHFFGLTLGIGFGGNSSNEQTVLGWNFHIGVAYSFGRHHRIEIERIFLPSPSTIDYQNTYLISYSFIF